MLDGIESNEEEKKDKSPKKPQSIKTALKNAKHEDLDSIYPQMVKDYSEDEALDGLFENMTGHETKNKVTTLLPKGLIAKFSIVPYRKGHEKHWALNVAVIDEKDKSKAVAEEKYKGDHTELLDLAQCQELLKSLYPKLKKLLA